jgi:sugar lactone lactonase YvrE
MKYFISITVLILALFSFKNKDQKAYSPMKLVKLWESDTLFTTAESVIFDTKSQIIYVSNIEGQPWDEDGKGSIGKLTLDGKVINAKWVTGLNAPKGLGIVNGKLYVADNISLVEIDQKSGKILHKYEVKDCQGLNDVATTTDGSVYFTDSKKGVVHLLKDGVVSTVVNGLGGSNGVFYESDRLLLGTWADSSLTAYNFKTQNKTVFAKNLPQPDGVEAIGNGSYLVSTWSGLIHSVDKNGKIELLLDTKKDKISAADIDFVRGKNLLLVPTFFRNTVVAYHLEIN